MPQKNVLMRKKKPIGGWRINNGKVESGLYSAHSGVDSFLSFQLNLQHEGSITFSYYLKNCSEGNNFVSHLFCFCFFLKLNVFLIFFFLF